jgi:hypothetical protein
MSHTKPTQPSTPEPAAEHEPEYLKAAFDRIDTRYPVSEADRDRFDALPAAGQATLLRDLLARTKRGPFGPAQGRLFASYRAALFPRLCDACPTLDRDSDRAWAAGGLRFLLAGLDPAGAPPPPPPEEPREGPAATGNAVPPAGPQQRAQGTLWSHAPDEAAMAADGITPEQARRRHCNNHGFFPAAGPR